MMERAMNLLKKNWLLLCVILSFCISIVCFAMGLVKASNAQYSISDLTIQVMDKRRVESEEKVVLKTEIKHVGKKDIAAVGFMIEIKDKDGNLLGAPAGTLRFGTGDEGLQPEMSDLRTLDYRLDFDNRFEESHYIYNMPFRDIDFSASVEWIEYTDGETVNPDTTEALNRLDVTTTGIITALVLVGIALGVFVYFKVKEVTKKYKEAVKD